MCGIVGIVGHNAANHRGSVAAMLASMEHRGPDGTGVYTSPSGTCILGHARLAIIDPSSASDQPFASKNQRNQLVYNGECYNFRELRGELQSTGELFTTSGDTEVVSRLLSLHGVDAFPKLNAMFALAFWDEDNQRLLLARDHFGQKPLYYAFQDGTLIFASEVRALLASGLVPRALCHEAVMSFLSYGCVQPPRTIIEGVWSLERGTSVNFSFKDSGTFIEKPWVQASYEANDTLKESFQHAVSRHLISDVPIGVFLSGGIDSSAVVAAARQSVTGSLVSLSVTFPDAASYSETEYSRAIAKKWETDHREIAFRNNDILKVLPDALSAMDQPTADGINTFVVSEAAKQAGLRVALSGLGGDEIFGGYSSFSLAPKALRYRQILRGPLAPLLCWFFSQDIYNRRMAKVRELFEAEPDIIGAYLSKRRMFTSAQMRTLLPGASDGWITGIEPARHSALKAFCQNVKEGDAVSFLEMAIYMEPMLLRDSDCMGMANSLEIRVPFLDAQFSAQALSIPADERLENIPPKSAFVRSLGDWLPDNISNRPKQGFVLPLRHWMTAELKNDTEAGIEQFARVCGGRNSQARIIWQRFLQQPDEVGWTRPWMLSVLGMYIERHKLSTADSLPLVKSEIKI